VRGLSQRGRSAAGHGRLRTYSESLGSSMPLSAKRKLYICQYADCAYQWLSATDPRRCPRCDRRGWQEGEVDIGGRPRTTPRPPIEKIRPQRAQQKAVEKIVPTPAVVSASCSPGTVEIKKEKLRGAVHVLGAKCTHGYMNWLLCPDCNPR
jgi:hypothetical protein